MSTSLPLIKTTSCAVQQSIFVPQFGSSECSRSGLVWHILMAGPTADSHSVHLRAFAEVPSSHHYGGPILAVKLLLAISLHLERNGKLRKVVEKAAGGAQIPN